MNVLRTKVDMFLEIYLDSWDHKLNEKLLFIIFVYYFGSLWLVWRDSHGLFLSFILSSIFRLLAIIYHYNMTIYNKMAQELNKKKTGTHKHKDGVCL